MVSSRLYTTLSILITILILLSYIFSAPILTLISTIAVCVMILMGNSRSSASVLFYFSNFSYVLLYKDFNMFIIVALSYIIAAFRYGQLKTSSLAYVIFIMMYTIVTSLAGPFGIDLGAFIPIVMLTLVFFVCSTVKYEDYEDVTDSAIFGSVIAGIIGFFVNSIPDLYKVLRHNVLWLSGSGISSVTVDRYSGLTYDSNFYGLVCIAFIAVILYRKHNRHQSFLKIALLFFVISGIITYSKTYIIVLVLLFLVYLLDVNKQLLKKWGIFAVVGIICVILDSFFDLNIIAPIFKRFSYSGIDKGWSSFTTGRTDIWLSYIKYIFGNGASIVFGSGIGGGLGRIAEHNLYLEFWCKFGTVGLYMWYHFFRSSYKTVLEKSTVKRSSIKSRIPMIMISIYCLALSAMTFRMLFVIICVSMFVMTQPEADVHKITDREDDTQQIIV